MFGRHVGFDDSDSANQISFEFGHPDTTNAGRKWHPLIVVSLLVGSSILIWSLLAAAIVWLRT